MGVFDGGWDSCVWPLYTSSRPWRGVLPHNSCAVRTRPVKQWEDRSCTDEPRQWGLPPVKADKALFEEGLGTEFSNPAKKRCGVQDKCHSGPSGRNVGVSTAAIEKIYKDLDNATPNPSEKSGLLCI